MGVRKFSCREVFQPPILSFEGFKIVFSMGSRARNQLKLFLESDLSGIIPKNSKTKKNAVILRLTHGLSGLKELNFKVPTVCEIRFFKF